MPPAGGSASSISQAPGVGGELSRLAQGRHKGWVEVINETKYVILGGGMVAGYAAKELVDRGLKPGELTIVSSDTALPYERPPLSKSFLSGKDTETTILINPAGFYQDHGIQVRMGTTIDKIDVGNRRLRSSSAEEFAFDKLLLATGARARTVDYPGRELANVFYLRSLDDSRNIRSRAATARQAAVIGGGFIGMEVASVLAQKGIETTMIIKEDRVWSRVFTRELSAFFERYYAVRGVHLIKQAGIRALEGKESVRSVVLAHGQKIPCDLVVAGIGAIPNTELLAGSGVALGDGVMVNEYLEASQPGVFATGDIANYPDAVFEKRRRVEHWDNAVAQGQYWACAVQGDRQAFVHVPYFFSDVFDLSYELWGDSSGATETVVRGDLATSSFSVWWLRRERVVQAFVMSRPDEEREVAPEWIRARQAVSGERLGDQRRSIRDALER
jgi:3-phenylpropionate/trans-cinnamate dioxygenase ferredoxin reductase component